MSCTYFFILAIVFLLLAASHPFQKIWKLPIKPYQKKWAGAGVKAGFSYGTTDDFGYNVQSNGVHVHDFQATLMHLLGINHEQLTFKFQGRRYLLTDVHGKVVKDILA